MNQNYNQGIVGYDEKEFDETTDLLLGATKSVHKMPLQALPKEKLVAVRHDSGIDSEYNYSQPSYVNDHVF